MQKIDMLNFVWMSWSIPDATVLFSVMSHFKACLSFPTFIFGAYAENLLVIKSCQNLAEFCVG